MDDSNRTNLNIVIVLFIVSIIVGVSITINRVFFKSSSNNKVDSTNDTSIEEKEDTSVDSSVKYKSYQIGDEVTLTNGVVFNVIKDSTSTENKVTLLKKEPLDQSFTYQNVSEYLENTYYKSLISSLGIDDYDTESVSVRLLTIDDIGEVVDIENVNVGMTLNDSKYTFLYNFETLTNHIEDNKVVAICNDNSSASICNKDSSSSLKVRPVVTINKKYISK